MPNYTTDSMGALLSISLVGAAMVAFLMLAPFLMPRLPFFRNTSAGELRDDVRGGRFSTGSGRAVNVGWGTPLDGTPLDGEEARETAAPGPASEAAVPVPRLGQGTVPAARPAEADAPADAPAPAGRNQQPG